MNIDKIFTEMAARWPSNVIAREDVDRFSGGAVSPRYLANLDSRGAGPKERLRIGRKVCYPVMPFIQWLHERSKVLPLKELPSDPLE
jgi:hypothetical protein